MIITDCYWREIAPKRFEYKLCECSYFGAVSVDPELVGVRTVTGPQRIRHLVAKSCEFGLSAGYKEDAENGKLREAFKKCNKCYIWGVGSRGLKCYIS